MKNIILFLSLLTLPLSTLADVQFFKPERGQAMAYELIMSDDNSQITLMLLPGVNRGLMAEDSAVKELKKWGWNILIPSLPSHPLSLQGLDKYEYASFPSSERVEDYALKMEALVDHLGLQTVIPVSLSYSSSVGASLNPQRFPHVIDTVPLVTAMETSPHLAAYMAQMESLAMLNPFLGPLWVRGFRDQSYRTHWSSTVYQNLSANSQMYGPSPRTSDIIDGYVAIARAVEDFDFAAKDFSQDNQIRDFVLAELEEPLRLEKQLQVLQNYLQTGKPCRVVVVKGAGHVLPSDKPTLYAHVVSGLAHNPAAGPVQFAIVSSAKNAKQIQWGGLRELENWMSSVQK